MIQFSFTISDLHYLQVLRVLIAYLLASSVAAQNQLETYVENGSVMLLSPEGDVLLSHDPEKALIPASLIKIPLAHVALNSLGENYHFETHFYHNAAGDILIRGLGDPFLVSEEIEVIAEALGQRQLKEVRRLVMDDSAFERDLDLTYDTDVNDPYAARNSALAVNFNTVSLAWSAKGELISGESQTPLTPLARELGAQLSQGEAQRINLGNDPLNGLRQTQQLFLQFLGLAGIRVTDSDFYQEMLSDEWTLFYRHISSKSLREILEGMLRFSNNFIANQLFLVIAAESTGYPLSTSNAREALQQNLSELYGTNFGKDPESLLMLEGSGLSRAQYSTAEGMIHILEAFKPYAELLTETNGVYYKSGTLTGVYNFAGYILRSDGLYPFVILTNQNRNNRDTILQLLKEATLNL